LLFGRTWVSAELEYLLPGKLEVQSLPGGGINEIVTTLRKSILQNKVFRILGISYFGNEHTTRSMEVGLWQAAWQELFCMLRSGAVLDRTVFFCGGYAAKYGYGPAYDENMTTIRRWIRQAGFEVRTDFQKVASWKLAADNLHWDVEMNRQLAEYWKDLLLGDRPTLDDDEIPPDIPLLPHVPSSMPPPSSQRSATPSFLHADGDPTIPAYQSDTLPLWMTQDVLPFSQRGGTFPRAPAQPTRATRVEVPAPTRNWWDSDEEKDDTLESPHFAER